MRTSEILNLAADQIESRGWVIGGDGWNNDDGSSLCLEGGLMAALELKWIDFKHDQHNEFRVCPAYVAVQEYLGVKDRPRDGGDGPELWRWNDNEAENAEHVIEVLRGAALVEAAKEEALEKVSA